MDIYKSINKKCKSQFIFYNNIQNYVEYNLLDKISVICKKNKENKEICKIQQAINLLISYGITNYKSSIILIQNGYATNSLIILRSLVEVIFTIEYIIEDYETAFNRANKYLESGSKMAQPWIKAESTLNKGLYKLYGGLCNFTHGNINATQHNMHNSKISIMQNDDKVEVAANTINGVYYYFINIICDYYKINKDDLLKIEVSEYLSNELDRYYSEKIITNAIMTLVEENGLDREEYLKGYKDYKIKGVKTNFKVKVINDNTEEIIYFNPKKFKLIELEALLNNKYIIDNKELDIKNLFFKHNDKLLEIHVEY